MLRGFFSLLLLLCAAANAFQIRNVTFYSISATRRDRRLDSTVKLWIVRPTQQFDTSMILAYVGNGTYIVKSMYLAEFEDGEYAPYNPAYKYRPNLNTTRGIIVKCITSQARVTVVDHIVLSPTRFLVRGPVSMDIVRVLAKSTNVLWIDAVQPRMKFGVESRRVLQSTTPIMPRGFGRIMITDIGLDVHHCAFNTRQFTSATLGLSGTIPVFNTSAVVNMEYQLGVVSSVVVDEGAHGTMTAGVAQGACNFGVYTPPGQSMLLFIETGSAYDSYLHFPRDLERLFTMAALNNISVHSASWGKFNPGQYDDESYEFDLYARRYDLLHVVSSGNSGGRLGSPATAKNAISVGAVLADVYPWYSGGIDSVVDFSSIGPTNDGRLAPTLQAPGYLIQVPYAFSTVDPGHDDDVYASGTSFSAPAIAGLALYIDEWHMNLTGVRASAALKKAILINSARPTRRYVSTPWPFNTISKPRDLSYGVPLITRASLDQTAFINNASIQTRHATCFAVAGNSSATLAWMDLPAHALLDDVLLVNDLDMRVYTESRELWLNNHVDPTERIQFNHTGVVRVVVRVVGVLSDAQTFALAVSNANSMWTCGDCIHADSNLTHLCNPTTGVMVAVVRSCAANYVWNGTACEPTIVTNECVLLHGRGVLVNTTCIPTVCDSFYYLDGQTCTCQFARACSGGQFVACESNMFPACSTQIIPTTHAADSGLPVGAIIGIVVGSLAGLALLTGGLYFALQPKSKRA